MSAPVWTKDPLVLISRGSVLEVIPKGRTSFGRQINALTRLTILMTLVVSVWTRNLRTIVAGGIAVLTIGIYAQIVGPDRENMTSRRGAGETASETVVPRTPPPVAMPRFTSPTSENPLMNVMLPEINGNPTRPPAAPAFSPLAQTKIDKVVKANAIKAAGGDERLFRGLDAELDFDTSMRSFYSTASTTVPNDQEAFAEFCYGGMLSGKEGDPMGLERSTSPRLGSVTN
jgi:hypothetical protein